jgi:DNA-directed RNA polymerase subunit RPC12/RpoP
MFWKNKNDRNLLKENEELREHVQKLEEENAYLKFMLEEFREKLFGRRKKKDNDKKDGKGGEDPPPKKLGAPEGHPGWYRKKPDQIDRIEEVHLEKCPECGSKDLRDMGKVQDHIQEDIILIARTIATLFRKHQYSCRACGKQVEARGKEELPNSYIGPRAKSLAVFLKYHIKVSDRDIQKLFRSLLGLTIVPSSIPGFRNQLRRYCKPLYEALLKKMKRSKVLNIDETGWKMNGIKKWLWHFSNKNVSINRILDGRGQKDLESVLGKKFDGIIISDFLSAYNKIEAMAKQRCLVHLLRELKKIRERIPDDEQAIRFAEKLEQIIQEAVLCASAFANGEFSRKELKKRREKIQRSIDDLKLANPTHRVLKRLIQRLERHKQEILTFLDYPGIDYHNNHAERQIRPNVLLRKIVFGNRSTNGILNHDCLMSVIQTANLNKLDPLKTLREFLIDFDNPRAISKTLPP